MSRVAELEEALYRARKVQDMHAPGTSQYRNADIHVRHLEQSLSVAKRKAKQAAEKKCNA